MDKLPRFLITTADERSWRSDRSALCLGSWCCIYGRKEAWEGLNAEVVPYHWDDREKLYHDYFYLRELHEVLLTELCEALNLLHGTRHSQRYWRILVGPWLLYFTQMLFDRWTMIQYAVQNYEIEGTVVLDFPPEQVVPKDMLEFRDLYWTDAWNHAIYGRILNGWTSVVCEKSFCPHLVDGSVSVKRASSNQAVRRLVRLVKNGVSRVSQLLNRKSDAFFIATTLPPKQDFLFQWALGQFPALNLPVPTPRIAPDLNVRKLFLLGAEKHKDFEHCVRTLIQEQIPTVYLEGYLSLQSRVVRLPWPKSPKVIFTSVSYNADDVFKAWAGLQVENGIPLIIGQHGGNLGSALWTSSEDHEIAIADRYLTWGWSDGNPKQYPVGVLKQIGRGSYSWDPKGHILLVSSVMPRYSYVMGSFTVATTQVCENLADQYRFVRALRKDIFEKLVVRLFMPDWDWAQSDRWRDQIQNVHLDSGARPIEPLMRQSRIYVSTYNATTFLESLSRNIPTIMFWNPKHWELRLSAEPYFDKLRHAGIYHTCPESAAAKVAEIWYDVEKWWSSSKVQDARLFFIEHFARVKGNSTNDLHEAIVKATPNHDYQQFSLGINQ